MLAATEGRNAAADYLALLVFALNEGGFNPGSDALAADAVEPLASLARLGLEFIGARRDTAWVILRGIDLIRRELDEPDYPGITLDSPERREFASVCQQLTFVPGIAASWPGARFGYSSGGPCGVVRRSRTEREAGASRQCGVGVDAGIPISHGARRASRGPTPRGGSCRLFSSAFPTRRSCTTIAPRGRTNGAWRATRTGTPPCSAGALRMSTWASSSTTALPPTPRWLGRTPTWGGRSERCAVSRAPSSRSKRRPGGRKTTSA